MKKTIEIGDLQLVYEDQLASSLRPLSGVRFDMDSFLASLAVSLNDANASDAAKTLVMAWHGWGNLAPEIKREIESIIVRHVVLTPQSNPVTGPEDMYVGDDFE